jgi:hypothetical protein
MSLAWFFSLVAFFAAVQHIHINVQAEVLGCAKTRREPPCN